MMAMWRDGMLHFVMRGVGMCKRHCQQEELSIVVAMALGAACPGTMRLGPSPQEPTTCKLWGYNLCGYGNDAS